MCVRSARECEEPEITIRQVSFLRSLLLLKGFFSFEAGSLNEAETYWLGWLAKDPRAVNLRAPRVKSLPGFRGVLELRPL